MSLPEHAVTVLIRASDTSVARRIIERALDDHGIDFKQIHVQPIKEKTNAST